MKCPHCQNDKWYEEVIEHPYPYIRKDKKGVIMQHIKKFWCKCCNNEFFLDQRHGRDMDLPPMMYDQIYKYGQYQYKYTKGIK